MKTIAFIAIIFLLNSRLPTQEIKLETLEDEWGIIPLIAVDQDKKGITDFTKPNLEILINNKNVRDFLILKKNFFYHPKEIIQKENLPREKKTIYFLFDTIFTSREGIYEAKQLAQNLIQRFVNHTQFVIMTIHPLKGLNYITGPLIDKKICTQEIENRVIWPYGSGVSNMTPEKRRKTFCLALQTMCGEILKSADLRFVFLFSRSLSRKNMGAGIAQKWPRLVKQTLEELKQCVAMMFFLNLSNDALKKSREKNHLLAYLSDGARIPHLQGDGSTIFRKTIQMMAGYYEITYPKLNKFSKPNRQMSIHTYRQNVFIYTPIHMTSPGSLRVTDFNNKGKTKITVPPGASIERSPSNVFPSTPPEGRVEKIIGKLSENRFNLELTTSKYYCGLAQVCIQQGQLKKAQVYLNKILESAEKNTGFVRIAIKELDKIFEANQTIKKTLEVVRLYIKISFLKNRKKLYESARENMNKEKKFFKVLGRIMQGAENHNTFVEKNLENPLGKVLNDDLDLKKNLTISSKTCPSLSRAALNQKKIEALFSPLQNTPSRFFIKKSLLNSLENKLSQILSRARIHIDFVQNMLKESGRSDEKETIDFVIRFNRQFPRDYKTDYYKKKLLELQVNSRLIHNPDFIDSLLPAQTFYLNKQQHLEALYSNHTVMVYIPAGKFKMGVPWEGGAQDESPRHSVFLDGYWISKYEITFEQFDKYCEETGRKKPTDSGFGRGRHPVINISWHDATTYCEWFSKKVDLLYRLPSEAEWEKAARGTQNGIYPWGNEKPDGERANFADINLLYHYERNNPPASKKEHQSNLTWMDRHADDNHIHTSPVGKYPAGASPYGMLDMAGNVWEMVFDWYDGDFYRKSPESNPRGPLLGTFKVTRGGGWDSSSWMLRATTRAGGDPHKGGDTLGFRIVFSKNS